MSDRIEATMADQEGAGQAAAEEQVQSEQAIVPNEKDAPAAEVKVSAVTSDEAVTTEEIVAEQTTTAAAEQTPPESNVEDATPSSETENASENQEDVQAEAKSEVENTSQPANDEPAAAPAVNAEAEADSVETAADATEETSSDDLEEHLETEEVVMPDGSKRMVRVLSVGLQLPGTVKRIADFGAFVDIGVGRDGLIHISELSVRRVGKVTDVLSEGQEINPWIKKLDRERNRISLTLIDPDTKTIRDLQKGEVVNGTVTRILPYGAFIDIGIGRDALLHVREMAEGFVAKPEDVVSVGEELEARVIDLSRRRGRVDLSLKGLRPEPEAAQPAQQETEVAADADEVEDQFEDVEVLSPMELAFKRAVEAEGEELNVPKKKSGKKGRRRGEKRSPIQDEIIERTLSNR